MDDEEWVIEDPSTAAPAAEEGAGGEAAQTSEEGGVQIAGGELFKSKRPQLYKHWVRPKFLQYNYMYDYRHNYYDDVISYLDKRQKGINCELPRPQTWAERVLRTHGDKYTKTTSDSYQTYQLQKKEDRKLVQSLSNQIHTYNYHTRAYINRKYSSLL